MFNIDLLKIDIAIYYQTDQFLIYKYCSSILIKMLESIGFEKQQQGGLVDKANLEKTVLESQKQTG